MTRPMVINVDVSDPASPKGTTKRTILAYATTPGLATHPCLGGSNRWVVTHILTGRQVPPGDTPLYFRQEAQLWCEIIAPLTNWEALAPKQPSRTNYTTALTLLKLRLRR